MATYAIGDIQGCFDQLQQLLDKLAFDPNTDRLWLTGDLVNRGPKSLEVLRFVRDLGDAAVTVLGNHDLHLLAVAAGSERPRRRDTLNEILSAPDRDELLHWLRSRPLLHLDSKHARCLIHAGLPPQWDLETAQRCAAEVESALQHPDYKEFLDNMYGNEPNLWRESLTGWDRLRFITNSFTRLRYCDDQGNLALDQKGPPGTQIGPYLPWFEINTRVTTEVQVIFGHWSRLGYVDRGGVIAMDTGCLWGGRLTARRLDGVTERTDVACPVSCEPSHH